MKRSFLAAGLSALFAATFVLAQDTKPAQPPAQPEQPKAGGLGKAQPDTKTNPFNTRTLSATRLATLEEDFETLEAHRDVKKAIVRAAEISVKGAELTASRTETLFAKGTITKEEVEKARLDIEAAKAQLEIRLAEMKEVEVKIKFARKRLDEAKATAVKLANPLPKAVDPVPPPAPAPQVDPKVVAELKAKLEKLTGEGEKAAAIAKKANEEAKVAADELEKILDIAKRGRVLPGTIEKAEAKAKAAKDAAEAAKKQVNTIAEGIAAVKTKLKEIEK